MSIDETSVSLKVDSPDPGNLNALVKSLQQIDKITKSKQFKDLDRKKEIEIRVGLEEAGVTQINERMETVLGDVKGMMETLGTINEVVGEETDFTEIKDDILVALESSVASVRLKILESAQDIKNKIRGVATRISNLGSKIEGIEIPDYSDEFEILSEDIANVPQPKDYTEQLEEIAGKFGKIPRYHAELEEISRQIGAIDIPVYDGEFDELGNKVDDIDIPDYTDRLDTIRRKISNIKIKDYTGRLETIKRNIKDIDIPDYADKFQEIIDSIEGLPEYDEELGEISTSIENLPQYQQELAAISREIELLVPRFTELKLAIGGIGNIIIDNAPDPFPMEHIDEYFTSVQDSIYDLKDSSSYSFSDLSRDVVASMELISQLGQRVEMIIDAVTAKPEAVELFGKKVPIETRTTPFQFGRTTEVVERFVEEATPEIREISEIDRESIVERITEHNTTIVEEKLEESRINFKEMLEDNNTKIRSGIIDMVKQAIKSILESSDEESIKYKSVLKRGDDEF